MVCRSISWLRCCRADGVGVARGRIVRYDGGVFSQRRAVDAQVWLRLCAENRTVSARVRHQSIAHRAMIAGLNICT